MTERIDPKREQVITPHEAWNKEKLAALIKSMREDGWQGLPLIGYRLSDNPYDPIWLLNGSHRVVAAQETGISIPVHIVELSEEARRELIQYGEPGKDNERMMILEMCDDERAIEIFEKERN